MTGPRHAGAPRSAQPEPVAEAADAGPGIPGGVALALEELPTDFWDEPPADPPGQHRAPPPPTAGGPATKRRGTARSTPEAVVGAGSLTRALLGGTTADEVAAGLRDTVAALEELFPGELLAVTATEDEGAPGMRGAPGSRGAPDNGGPPDDDGAAAAGAELSGQEADEDSEDPAPRDVDEGAGHATPGRSDAG